MTEDEGFKLETLYADYLRAKKEADECKEKFDKLAEKCTAEGIKSTPSGMKIVCGSRVTQKIDSVMFQTLHPDVYDELVKQGKVQITSKALEGVEQDVSDCIESKTTVFYTLKG